jgi:hypothetical protein
VKITILLIAVSLTVGCNPLKKAQDQFKLHPESFALLTSRYYPCVPTHIVDSTIHIDDTAYKRSVSELLDYFQQQADTLNETLELLQLDSINRMTLIERQQKAIASLQNKINNIKPVIKEIPKPYKVVDSATLQVLHDIIAQKDKTVSDTTAQYASLKSSSHWWKTACLITWGIIAVYLIGWIVSKIYGRKI